MEALLYPTGSLPTFENLTRLELSSNASDGWRMLASILDSSPLLETLVFRKGFLDKSYTCGNPFPPPENVPVCLSSHLQVIRIHRFLGEEDEYKWVEYFLTNALVLEKMEIHPRLCKCKEEEYSSSFEVKCENEDVPDGISILLRNFKISTRLSTVQPLSEGC